MPHRKCLCTHYHIAIRFDLAKKFNGTEQLFAEWNFTGEPPSKNCRMSPPSLLNYQINIFPGQGFSCGVFKWCLYPYSCELLTLDTAQVILYFRNPQSTPQVPKMQHNCVHGNLLEKPKEINSAFFASESQPPMFLLFSSRHSHY